MRIAVTYVNGQIFQHFERTEWFKIFDLAEKEITKSEILEYIHLFTYKVNHNMDRYFNCKGRHHISWKI